MSSPSKCWVCDCDLPESNHFAVDFLGVKLCSKCDRDARAAQNRVKLPKWEEAHRRLSELRRSEESET
jgi:hypothetical protein